MDRAQLIQGFSDQIKVADAHFLVLVVELQYRPRERVHAGPQDHGRGSAGLKDHGRRSEELQYVRS